ncbi:MAG: aminotransferase class IV [Deltaproteobacteria bacterium]|jgi:branched-chain amino acid aminotransferase|nr:aminotransferase class IV [Deltaproteobacteria bacterium]
MASWPVYTTAKEFAEASPLWRKPWHDQYLVMFSSFWGGFVTDPALWGIPPDDHMVHRGDAVFEALKCIGGRIYCLEEHLARLRRSAEGLALPLPPEMDQIQAILTQAYQLAGREDLLIRLNVSRGPGSFTVNPYDAKGSQLYVTLAGLKKTDPRLYEEGIRLHTSPFPAQTLYAGIKSCNYLQQVLAKKAALDAGADYVVSFDQDGFLTEGATENAAVITKDLELWAPSYDKILRGVTLGRVLEHAQELVKEGLLKSAGHRDLTRPEIQAQAQEIFLTATTFDILPVSSWDGRPVGGGRPGRLAAELRRRLVSEIQAAGPHTFSLMNR